MCQNGKEGRFLEGVISPAFAGGAPEFEKISQSCSGDKDQDGCTIIGGGDDKQRDEQDGEQRVGFVEGGGDEIEQEGEETGEEYPVEGF